MDHVLVTAEHQSLPLSVRIMRLILSTILGYVIAVEMSVSGVWELVLSILALYSFATGVVGRDPVFEAMKLSIRQMPGHMLGLVAQIECMSIGIVCILAGILNRETGSLVVQLLPFVGIYPILLCAIRYDLLGYLLHSYRKD